MLQAALAASARARATPAAFRLLSTAAPAAGAATASNNKNGTAIVLMNMGGPATLDEVEPFLGRLFGDPDIIPIPFQSKLGPWIAKNRTPKIKNQYAQIGGGSPIRMWTEKQGQMLERLLDETSPETAPHKSFVAFRYAAPLTDEAVRAVQDAGFTRAVAFTQYPQYSCSTTGSSLNELHRQLRVHDKDGSIQWSVIDRWPTHPKLVDAFLDRIHAALQQYPENERDSVVILFSAHSLPMTVIERGDPYVHEVAATVQAVMDKLGHTHPYRLAWQSKVGPRAWMGPQTADVLEALGKKGHKNVLLVPIAFTSDHIETLFELDIEYGTEAREKWGLTGLKRAESLNDSPIFIEAMADVVKAHLARNVAASPLLQLQCPMCTKESCRDAKAYFAAHNATLQAKVKEPASAL
ncbi:hypothetical protein GGF31_008969 [Allomyces arbusculus]|nr:hypothetical protein GGF31_008969 [Allomyces arbusculus]